MIRVKPKEKEFCHLLTVCADPLRAAEKAGYKHPEKALALLVGRDDIVEEIRRLSENIRSVYESTAICGLYQLACGGIGDALELVYGDAPSSERLRELDLTCVQEIKKTDKGIEIKFCDRVKAVDKLSEMLASRSEQSGAGGLLDAIMLSAETLGQMNGLRGNDGEV